jgi:hypothetical protein
MNMKKLQVLSVFVAVLAFSALAVASASATLWLEAGKSVTANKSVDSHGTLELRHTGGLFGNSVVLCSALTHGTVGPNGVDETTSILDLAGHSAPKEKITCQLESGFCPGLVLVTVNGLPWKTQLVLNGTTTEDTVTGTGSEAGYTTECGGLKVTCNKNEKAVFTKNGANGAVLEDLGTSTASCSDGGTGTVKGSTELLGMTVS